MTDLSIRAARLAGQLAAWPRRRVTLTELWRILDKADPATRTDAARRGLLAAALEELAGSGLLTLPAARSYDRTESPHLPRFITVPRSETPSAPQRNVVWHHALSWVPDAQLTLAQLDRLEQVNNWLHTHRDPLIVPLRERSLEIFGHEKTLDRLITTNLFAPGRLTFATLRARRARVRFTTESVGDGDGLLIVENSDTFDSLVHALRHHHGHQIGTVGWGAGACFEASVLSVSYLEPPVHAITYFGDLDQKGLRIPTNAAALALAEGLPPIRPATGLYDALFTIGAPQPGQQRLAPSKAGELAAWLHPRHRTGAITHLLTGQRLAQEAVGLQHLLTHDNWLSNE